MDFSILTFVIASGLVALIFAFWNAKQILKESHGSDKMYEIGQAIREGSMAYLKKQYSILAIFVAVVAILIGIALKWETSVSFVFGALSSALAGYIGMNIATLANTRTAEAAKHGMSKAMNVAFASGSVMALFAAGIGLIGVTTLYYFFADPQIILGFAFGASSVALFARVGGGIFTKAADMGADLVGKVEQHIPEDDPRNPAVIADNVGDNVGDVAGMGADLFESYVGSIIAAMAIGIIAITGSATGVMFPMMLAAVGIVASIIASFYVKLSKSEDAHKVFNYGIIIASLIVAVVSYFLTDWAFGSTLLFWSILAGLVTGILIGLNTDRYTSEKEKYVKSIATAAEKGSATTIIQGLVVGMRSTKNTLLFIVAAIFVSFYLGSLTGLPNGGLYGVALAALAMLSTLGISLAVDAFGPVVDNAGGIAEMSNLPADVREITDALDAAGNTTAAIGKGFAIGSAALTGLALFATYGANIAIAKGIDEFIINAADPRVLLGLFIGGMLPFYFSALTMNSVGKAALEMVEEVRRQFREIKGIMEGKAKPDYGKCIEISTNAALREMVVPGLLAILTPLVIGIVFGAEAVGGLLAGTLITGVSLAVMLSNSGGAYDNAKKLIESNKQDTKEWHAVHDASVVGDTVGDPFKDTSGPALNILIKLMTIVSLVSATMFLTPLI